MTPTATQRFDVAQTFGVQARPGLEVLGFADETHPQIPVRRPYVFRNAILRDILAFLHEAGGDGMFLAGPTGSGKTSLIAQVAARLSWPVQSVTCHGRMEAAPWWASSSWSRARPASSTALWRSRRATGTS